MMVDKRNMSTQRPSNKLDHKKARPFPIVKVVGKLSFRVQLLEGSQAHLTSHMLLLEPYHVRGEECRGRRPPTPEPIDAEVNWFVVGD